MRLLYLRLSFSVWRCRSSAPRWGESLVPLLRNDPDVEWRTDFLIENYGNLNFSGVAVYQAIRHQDLMYAYYAESGDEEIYDLVADPYEMESQACNPSFDDERLAQRQRIDQLMTNATLKVVFPAGALCD